MDRFTTRDRVYSKINYELLGHSSDNDRNESTVLFWLFSWLNEF